MAFKMKGSVPPMITPLSQITSSRTVNGKKQWRIIVNKDLSKQNYKRLLRDEEGHVFQEKTKIASKLKPDLKRYLIKQSTLKGYTPRQKLEETLSGNYIAHINTIKALAYIKTGKR